MSPEQAEGRPDRRPDRRLQPRRHPLRAGRAPPPLRRPVDRRADPPDRRPRAAVAAPTSPGGCLATWRRSSSRPCPSGRATATPRPRELAEDLGRFLAFEPVQARRISPARPLLAACPPPPGGHDRRLGRRRWRSWPSPPSPTSAIANERDLANVERDRALGLAGAVGSGPGQGAVRPRRRAAQPAPGAPHLDHAPSPRAGPRHAPRAAAALAPDPAMRLALRDEAVELLASPRRRQPARPAHRRASAPWLPLDLPAPAARPGRVAAVAEDGRSVTLWDVEGRHAPETFRLGPLPPEAAELDSSPRPPLRPAVGPGWPRP